LGTKAEARPALAARGNPCIEDYFRFHGDGLKAVKRKTRA
jgi:hypothetical protein